MNISANYFELGIGDFIISYTYDQYLPRQLGL